MQVSLKVIVTGAGDSVGRAIAERFAADGANVYICDVNQGNLDATLAANPTIKGMRAAIGNDKETIAFFDAALAQLGACDVLVNTVGIGGPRALTENIDLQEWRAMFASNLDGMLMGMQRVIPGMKARRSGVIINFSSASTKTGMVSRSAYIAVKCAVEGLTMNAARELGEYGIRCNAILPGIIDNVRMSGIMNAAAVDAGISLQEMENRYLKFISTRSKVTPTELAETIHFLSSDASRNITGQMISVDGNLEWEN
jgi:NAD(P)-dependent dehydrogenase (short-subunit alcohol dehydrogenase family)